MALQVAPGAASRQLSGQRPLRAVGGFWAHDTASWSDTQVQAGRAECVRGAACDSGCFEGFGKGNLPGGAATVVIGRQ